MAGPTLGTLLIQRLDAALGTTLSQQTQIVNRASADPVTHLGQPVRPEPVSNTLVRDGRTNVDRATQGAIHTKGRADLQPSSAEPAPPGRASTQNVTTSATTSLGLAARIILNLFANQAGPLPPVTARAPLINSQPQALSTPAPSTTSTAPESAPDSRPATPVHTTPGIGNTTQLAQTLARALAQNLQQSGLFYESHLKHMASGQYRLRDIQQEPQAQIRNSTTTTTGTPTATAQTAPSSATPSAAPSATPGTPSQALQQLPIPGLDPATHGIVRQQLEALADQSIHWRGEAWPGAPMDWHVRRSPEHDTPAESPSETTGLWQSEITIQLPRLGNVTAAVRLAGDQLYVTLQANSDTTPLLQQHAGQLYDQMSARQLELTSITFSQSNPDTIEPETENQP